MTPSTGRVVQICPSCDLELTDASSGPACPTCGTKLVEIRDESDSLIGEVIDGRFEIRDKLGQGGMGTVYRAWQRSVGREVAVKLIDRAYSRDPMSVRRFLREARLASQLSQPNTVSVFDFGQAADGRLFIVMELIRGRTLHKIIELEGTFSTERVVRVGVQICDALEAAHGAGIIHRDLKLENIIVLDEPPGRDLVKVLDFGLAKNIREPGSRGTESGVVVGTPRYMAPEAAMTGESLPAGDMYAVGVMLGELAAGKPLWEGESLPHLIAQKLDPERALRLVPAPLQRIVRGLIDPEPQLRPTAPQVRQALVLLADGSSAAETVPDLEPNSASTISLRTPREPTPVMAAPTGASLSAEPLLPPPTSRRTLWLVSGALAIGATIGVALVLARREGTVEPSARPASAAPADARPVAAAAPLDAIAVTPAPPATVALHVISEPPGARIYVTKDHIATAPFDLVVERAAAKLTVHATLAGYAPAKVEVVPDQAREVRIVLHKIVRSEDDKVPF